MEVEIFRNLMLNENKRVDGRKFDEIRPITIEVGVLPRTHGSAIFTRGETQALVTVTLGTPTTRRRSKTSKARPASASCSTTTSRRSRSAK